MHALDPGNERGGGQSRRRPSWPRCGPRVAALETENAELMAEQTKLGTERDILRQAVKYFAGETNW